jgi:spermidine synthase
MLDKRIIYNEMMIHIPLCTHKDAKKVLVVGEVNEHFTTELAKYSCEIVYANEFNTNDIFDVIIYTKNEIDEFTISNIDKNLNQNDGIFVFKTVRFNKDKDKLIYDLKVAGKISWIAMPYSFGHITAIFGSKKYHPQADIILDRSDFIDAQYYNTELHNASFIHPTYLQKALLKIAKR